MDRLWKLQGVWRQLFGESLRARPCPGIDLARRRAKAQVSFPVSYKGLYIGEYLPDLVVELKCSDRFANEHLAQCVNYLKVSGLRVALLINFQRSKLQWRRILLHPDNR